MTQTGPNTFTTEFLDGVTFQTYLSGGRFGIVFEVWASWSVQESEYKFRSITCLVARREYTWEQVLNVQG